MPIIGDRRWHSWKNPCIAHRNAATYVQLLGFRMHITHKSINTGRNPRPPNRQKPRAQGMVTRPPPRVTRMGENIWAAARSCESNRVGPNRSPKIPTSIPSTELSRNRRNAASPVGCLMGLRYDQHSSVGPSRSNGQCLGPNLNRYQLSRSGCPRCDPSRLGEPDGM